MNNKKQEEILKDVFKQWNSAVDRMIEQAEKGYMPLICEALKLVKVMLTYYQKAFVSGINMKNKK